MGARPGLLGQLSCLLRASEGCLWSRDRDPGAWTESRVVPKLKRSITKKRYHQAPEVADLALTACGSHLGQETCGGGVSAGADHSQPDDDGDISVVVTASLVLARPALEGLEGAPDGLVPLPATAAAVRELSSARHAGITTSFPRCRQLRSSPVGPVAGSATAFVNDKALMDRALPDPTHSGPHPSRACMEAGRESFRVGVSIEPASARPRSSPGTPV